MHSIRFVALITLFLLFPLQAQAYVDPGTGAFIVQVLLAALAGSLFYIRQILASIRRFLGLERREKTAPDEPDDPADNSQDPSSESPRD